MTERVKDEDVRNAPIRWKIQGAGMAMAGGFVALVDRDSDPFPCMVYKGPEEVRKAHERACRETWATAWVLEGDTMEEARKALAESRFLGTVYHLSDRELLDDRPEEHAP